MKGASNSAWPRGTAIEVWALVALIFCYNYYHENRINNEPQGQHAYYFSV